MNKFRFLNGLLPSQPEWVLNKKCSGRRERGKGCEEGRVRKEEGTGGTKVSTRKARLLQPV